MAFSEVGSTYYRNKKVCFQNRCRICWFFKTPFGYITIVVARVFYLFSSKFHSSFQQSLKAKKKISLKGEKT